MRILCGCSCCLTDFLPITWDNEKRILTIGDRKGRFAGMFKNRKFIVNIAGSSSSKTVCYNGRELRIEF